MVLADAARKLLVASGLVALTLSLLINPNFARDNSTPPKPVPEPTTTALLAVAGAAGIAMGVIRRRKK